MTHHSGVKVCCAFFLLAAILTACSPDSTSEKAPNVIVTAENASNVPSDIRNGRTRSIIDHSESSYLLPTRISAKNLPPRTAGFYFANT